MDKKSVSAQKLSMAVKLGYGCGSFVRNVENFFCLYIVLYLTTVVGIAPAIAGTVYSIALWVGAFTTVIIGYLSDNSTNPKGRRRPFIIAALFPLAILCFIFFVQVDFGPVWTVVYYIAIAVGIYITFNCVLIPYESLGGELSEDYDDRSNIQAIGKGIVWISIFLMGSIVIILVDALQDAGYTAKFAWMMGGLVCSATLFIGVLVSWIVTKGKEPLPEQTEKKVRQKGWLKNIFKEYLLVLKVKQTRLFILWDFVFFLGQVLMVGGMSYFILYVLGTDEGTLGLIMAFTIVFSIPGIIVANILCDKIGKKATLILATFLYGFGLVFDYFFAFTGAPVFLCGILYQFWYGFPYAMAFAVCFAMLYDSAEINEYRFGSGMMSALVGVFVFVMTLAVAAGNWSLGMILQIAGFDGTAAVQTEQVQNAIGIGVAIVPAILMFISIIFLLKYKINKRNHDALVEALELKRQGKEFSEAEFKEILE